MPEQKPHYGRIITIVLVILAFIGLVVISNSQKRTTADKTWDLAMTVGDPDAKHLYVMYTDLACPYCDVFSHAALEHWDEFVAFLNENSILFEIRLTETLYLGNNSTISRDAAEAAYCAKRDDKFWEYYHGAITALWDDYQSKGIGSNKSAPAITNLPDDYWLEIGHEIGLGADFDQCVAAHDTADEVFSVTNRSASVASGMPTFVFDKFTTSGFSDTWGWDYVKLYLEAGLDQ